MLNFLYNSHHPIKIHPPPRDPLWHFPMHRVWCPQDHSHHNSCLQPIYYNLLNIFNISIYKTNVLVLMLDMSLPSSSILVQYSLNTSWVSSG